jgi:hypothetical protein
MKLSKMLGLAVVTALASMATMAFVGTGSASAFHWRGYCSQPEWLCTLVNVFRLRGRPLWRWINTISFKSAFVTVECEKGMATGSETEEELAVEGNIKSTIEPWTLEGCKGCTSAKVSTPLESEASLPEEAGKGWVFILPKFSVTFSGCPLGVSCTYGGKVTAPIENEEEAGGAFNANGAELKKEAGGAACSSTIQWFGRWRLVYELHITGMQDAAWWTWFI